MARVVQRRSNPPYLLFVFVFLFLVAATLAVIGFMKADEIEQKITKLEKDKDELLAARNALTEETAELAREIVGTNRSAAEAMAASKAAVEATGLDGGLAAELKSQHNLVEQLRGQIAKLNEDLKKKEQDIESKNATLEKQRALLEEDKTETNKQIADLQKQLKDAQDDYEKRLKQHEESLASVRAEMNKELDEKNKQLEQLVLTMQEKDQMIAELRNTVDDLKALLTPGGQDVVNEPDGEIVKTAPGTDTCYINLGGKSNVRQGMSFAVYGRDAEYKEDVKGKIRVVKVGDNISECKVVEEDQDNPIAQGDGVANLAFHVNRTYNFVVQGRFDLYGTGQPSEFGRQAVKDAIKRFGGQLSDGVQVQTDYVVMGAEPAKPTKPAPDAPASVQRAYQDQMQQYQEYVDTLNLAQSMKIPVLNGHRFMALTGYLPEQKPE